MLQTVIGMTAVATCIPSRQAAHADPALLLHP